MEISIDAHKAIKNDFESFLFFSGDGDFAPLYKLLISLHKQVIVIFAHGHMGKEVYQIEKRIFTKAVDKLGVDIFV
ncbi:MAG: NYN domain-containing protein [Candidatus Blackburnbacteria bacterium]|nr:NYN domain-containing protein [Candidatus Blackburnbacteria bacterium]